MRDILREIVADPSDAYRICPPPKVSGDTIQAHGFEGIEDPRGRVLAETAAQLLQMADRRREERDPRHIEALREIIGKSGYKLVEIEPNPASSAA